MPIYYKVVSVINGKFYSYVVDRGPYRIEYKLGETITDTKLNGIFVFDSIKRAYEFFAPCNVFHVAILSVESSDPILSLPYYYEPYSLVCGSVLKWKTLLYPWPLGTVCLQSINVLKVEAEYIPDFK